MKEKSYFFTHKFLPVLSVFLLCFFIFCTTCFAISDLTFTNSSNKDITISLPDEYFSSTYHLILEVSRESLYPHYYIYYGEYPCFIDDTFSNSTVFCLTTGSFDKEGNFGHYYGKDISNPTFTYSTASQLFLSGVDTFDVSRYKWLECNHVVKKISNDDVVFQGAPVTVEQVTIPAIQQVEEIPQAMGEVLKILIPIGLIVLSIGFVIYLMRLVILRVQ